jgi:hypothetical protein
MHTFAGIYLWYSCVCHTHMYVVEKFTVCLCNQVNSISFQTKPKCKSFPYYVSIFTFRPIVVIMPLCTVAVVSTSTMHHTLLLVNPEDSGQNLCGAWILISHPKPKPLFWFYYRTRTKFSTLSSRILLVRTKFSNPRHDEPRVCDSFCDRIRDISIRCTRIDKVYWTIFTFFSTAVHVLEYKQFFFFKHRSTAV